MTSGSVGSQFSINLAADLTDMLSHGFMENAFLAGTAMAVIGGFAGYFVVLRRMTFAGEALSHVAFTAALGSVLLGFDPLIGMFVITIGVAAGMAALTNHARSYDVMIGTVLAWVLGLGALFLTIYTSSPSAGSNGQIGVSVLFGSILGIQSQAAVLAAVVAGATIVLLAVIARPLLFASLDPAIALVRGTPVRLVAMLFLIAMAVVVTEGVQVVGALLVLSLLVMPAAIAHRLTVRPFRAMFLSATLAALFTWAGLTLGYYLPYPISFFITSIAFVSYLAVVVAEWGLERWRRHEQASRSQERLMVRSA